MPNHDLKQITKEAKKIMDNFMKALDKIKNIDKYGSERDNCLRIPSENKNIDSEFKNNMLDNAPKSKDDCIQAEKKTW